MLCVWILFFFKQKTAYEMRISDCSSDVCSSDLRLEPMKPAPPVTRIMSVRPSLESCLIGEASACPQAEAPQPCMGHNDKCFFKARLFIITVQPRRRPLALGDVAAAQENCVQRGVGSWRKGANAFGSGERRGG